MAIGHYNMVGHWVESCPDCNGPPLLPPGALHSCDTCGGWGFLEEDTRWPPKRSLRRIIRRLFSRSQGQ